MAPPMDMETYAAQATSFKEAKFQLNRRIAKQLVAQDGFDELAIARSNLERDYKFTFNPVPLALHVVAYTCPDQEQLRQMIHSIILADRKCSDPDKYMPRQERLDAIMSHKCFGDVNPPRNFMGEPGTSSKQCAWNHDVGENYQWVLNPTHFNGFRHRGIPGIYHFTFANQMADRRAKTPKTYSPQTPVEDAYNIILQHHVKDGRHRGRDATYGPISKVTACITKELVSDFCNNCPGCKDRVQASQVGHQKRKEDGTEGCKKKIPPYLQDADGELDIRKLETHAWVRRQSLQREMSESPERQSPTHPFFGRLRNNDHTQPPPPRSLPFSLSYNDHSSPPRSSYRVHPYNGHSSPPRSLSHTHSSNDHSSPSSLSQPRLGNGFASSSSSFHSHANDVFTQNGRTYRQVHPNNDYGQQPIFVEVPTTLSRTSSNNVSLDNTNSTLSSDISSMSDNHSYNDGTNDSQLLHANFRANYEQSHLDALQKHRDEMEQLLSQPMFQQVSNNDMPSMPDSELSEINRMFDDAYHADPSLVNVSSQNETFNNTHLQPNLLNPSNWGSNNSPPPQQPNPLYNVNVPTTYRTYDFTHSPPRLVPTPSLDVSSNNETFSLTQSMGITPEEGLQQYVEPFNREPESPTPMTNNDTMLPVSDVINENGNTITNQPDDAETPKVVSEFERDKSVENWITMEVNLIGGLDSLMPKNLR